MTKTSPLRLPLLVAALLLSLTTVGCIPTRLGVGWAGLSTIGERQNILVAYNDFIVMVDPATGQEVQLLDDEGKPRIDPDSNQVRRWVVNGIQGAQFFGVPLQLDENTLLAVDYNKRLFRINISTARIETPAGTPINSQVVADLVSDGENVFLPSYNKGMIAINVEDGADVDWTMNTDNGIWSKPLLYNDTLYFGSMDHQLYAVDAADGSIKWQLELEGAVASSPVVYEDKLYIGSFARKLFEISLDGEVLNTYTTEDWIWSAPVIKDGILYAADLDGYVYALNIADGQFIENWKTKATGRGIRPSPLVTDEFVVVAGRDGQIDWLGTGNGVITIKQDVQSEILSDILLIQPSETLNIAEPLVIISTINSSQLLVAFTLNEGAKSWVYAR